MQAFFFSAFPLLTPYPLFCCLTLVQLLQGRISFSQIILYEKHTKCDHSNQKATKEYFSVALLGV